jgi:hypothetical protein
VRQPLFKCKKKFLGGQGLEVFAEVNLVLRAPVIRRAARGARKQDDQFLSGRNDLRVDLAVLGYGGGFKVIARSGVLTLQTCQRRFGRVLTARNVDVPEREAESRRILALLI